MFHIYLKLAHMHRKLWCNKGKNQWVYSFDLHWFSQEGLLRAPTIKCNMTTEKKNVPHLVAFIFVEDEKKYGHDCNDTQQDECISKWLPGFRPFVSCLLMERGINPATHQDSYKFLFCLLNKCRVIAITISLWTVATCRLVTCVIVGPRSKIQWCL